MRRLRASFVAASLAIVVDSTAGSAATGALDPSSGIVLARQSKADKACGFQSIACGQTKTGSIDSSDCFVSSGHYTDFWDFPGVAGQHVLIEASSSNMDTFLVLLDAEDARASDDDSGPGTDSRLEFDLDFTETWTISVSNIIAFDFGSYSVKLTCNAVSTGCIPDADTLCLNNGRFKVEATYQTAQTSGAAQGVKLTDETGYLWFFNSNNVEAMVKVLNACGVNGRYWVFAAGLTNQGVNITITDTQNPSAPVRHYTNPLNTIFVTKTDTDAFATCP